MPTGTPTPNVCDARCVSRRVLGLIADTWTALVFYNLEPGPKRFRQLQRGVGGILQKMLTQTLRDLERNGLVRRTVYPTAPPAVEYQLTPLGETLVEPLRGLRRWAEEHLPEVDRALVAYDGAADQGRDADTASESMRARAARPSEA